MASELINKIKKLQNLIIKANNEQFKKTAVEIINPEKVDEDLFCAPSMSSPDDIDETPAGDFSHPDDHHHDHHHDDHHDHHHDDHHDHHHDDHHDHHHDHKDGHEVEEPEINEPCHMLKVESMIRKSIAEEQEAASAYVERAAKCLKHGEHKLAGFFEELAGDEIVHVASLETALDLYGMFDPHKFIQGQEEAELLLQEGQNELAKKEQKDRDNAEKVRKEFDFAKEYTKNKAEYKKEQIVNSINDLILGKVAVDDVVDTVIKAVKSSKLKKKEDKNK